MNYVLKIIFSLFLSITIPVFASLTDSTASKFIHALIWERDKLESFVLHDEWLLSQRLCITYNAVQYKFLISNDIPVNMVQEIRNNRLGYKYSIENLEAEYSKLIFSVTSLDFKREYFFKNSVVVSQPYYYAKKWSIINSKYFVFHVSDRSLLYKYSINKLDDFVDSCSILLKFNNADIQKLEKNKIHYYLCKDENEIKLVTGFNTRGLYYIPYDYVISTYSFHTHELLHLLINYKLKNIPLYALPFFQEGFAVAFGGRGGQDQSVLLNMGLFLEQSGFLSYSSLLSKPEFYQNDITMSYPVAGLYNKFLFEYLGADEYLKLYKKYCSDESEADKIKVSLNDLPNNSVWQDYLKNISGVYQNISTSFNYTDNYKLINHNSSYSIYESGNNYLFKLKDPLFISVHDSYIEYKSKIFTEYFPNRIYNSEKYLIIADSNEVSVYNLYTNSLIAIYIRSFSQNYYPIKQIDGYFNFIVKKDVFEEFLGICSFSK